MSPKATKTSGDRRIDKLLENKQKLDLAAAKSDLKRQEKSMRSDLEANKGRSALSWFGMMRASAARLAQPKIAKGDGEGWRMAEQLSTWSSIAGVLLEKADSGTGCVIAHELARGRRAVALRLAEVLVAAAKREASLLAKRPLNAFMVDVARWAAANPKKKPLVRTLTTKLGPYQALVDGWLDPEAFAAALPDVLERHVAQAADENAAEFTGLYTLYPVELEALRRVRSDAGFAWIEVAHALLDTPFAAPPKAHLYDPKDDEVWRALRPVLVTSGFPESDLALFP